MHLARREILIVIESLLERFKSIRIPEGQPCAFHTGSVLGLGRLALEWD
jgi:hypothetical protein